eukprot:TRINITY_DN132_c0_g1_i1.p4 TRINITY_DN132_c0_g1~~TRINITY_DN132_c0_g1_i1.p4  ORF type:complete len:322 (-),score=42.64 TRINITY_DN132_c0_g1_i1:4406-5371(-)
MKDLEARLEEYKEQKAAKKLRKAKWDNWRKTQAIRYSKMSTNYQKWDYFENDSSDDEEQKKEPIIPDDPNVKMLEKDIEERGKRRRENRRQAEEIKDRGNDYMKKGKYKAAYKKYTQAIELSRDYFILYTNRALASLKMEKWNDVVEDCTKVLDYCECFDEGYTKHKDLCYKALLRRAAALQGMKKLDLAKKDVEEALNLFPNMEEPTKLLKRINEDIELEEKATEAIKLSENSELLQQLLLNKTFLLEKQRIGLKKQRRSSTVKRTRRSQKNLWVNQKRPYQQKKKHSFSSQKTEDLHSFSDQWMFPLQFSCCIFFENNF